MSESVKLVVAVPPAVEPPRVDAAPALGPFIVPSVRRWWVIALLSLHALLDVAAIGPAMATLWLIARVRAEEPFDEDAGPMIDLAAGLIGQAQSAVFIATAVVFSCWFYRVVTNARMLTSERWITGGWAAASFYIPFVNMVLPALAAIYAWKWSVRAAYAPGERRPSVAIVVVWWVMWIVGNTVIGVFSAFMTGGLFREEEVPLEVIAAMQYAILPLAAVSIASAVLCMMVVQKLTVMQKLAARWG